jgi:hypothetical protein
VPDQWGNPTEAERRGQVYQPTSGYTGAFTPRDPNIATRDIYDGTTLLSHDERAMPERGGAKNAPAFQGSAFMDDPANQRADVRNVTQATNKDTLGKGHYGARGWAKKHPLGVIGAFIAAAAGGASAMGWSPGAAGGGGAGATGWGGEGTGGFNGASDFGPGMQVGGGNAGNLANAGGISGGAGIGGGSGGSMASQKMPQMPGQQKEQPKNTWLADELERQAKEKELKKQIADELGPRYV